MIKCGIINGPASNKRQFIWFEHEMLVKHAMNQIDIETATTGYLELIFAVI